jgi:hypothetical protein
MNNMTVAYITAKERPKRETKIIPSHALLSSMPQKLKNKGQMRAQDRHGQNIAP